MRSVKGHKDEKHFGVVSEPCESSLFSCYINADGEYFPCSFAEGEPGWETGVDVKGCGDFVKDVWNHPKTEQFRNNLLRKCRNCPLFEI
jgi:radical SAM protein with 4Fe4S-binding SPASM domain